MDFDGICTVRRAGVTPAGRAVFDLKAENGTFDWTWLQGNANSTREMLAIALAAIASEKQVNCIIQNPAPFADVLGMVIIK